VPTPVTREKIIEAKGDQVEEPPIALAKCILQAGLDPPEGPEQAPDLGLSIAAHHRTEGVAFLEWDAQQTMDQLVQERRW